MIDQLRLQALETLQNAITTEPTYFIGFVLIGVVVSWTAKETVWNV